MGIGFNDGEKEKNIYDVFIGKPGHYGVGNVSATGILKEVNVRGGYLSVQPSLVGYGDAGIRIEKETPTIISLSVGSPISMRPLKDGDLDSIMEEHKQNVKVLSKK
ncbi:hypothetical protein HOD29_01025 [archaeon]|jgi:hypothetical protein|nr:hypothetical protein [archaeon]